MTTHKKPALTKTFHQNTLKKETPKHRRVDSGGKKVSETILEQISKRKRTNSDNKDSRNKTPDEGKRLSLNQSKLKPASYSNFSHHFNYNDAVKAKKVPKPSQPIYKRMAPPTKSMTTKHEASKDKKFNFDL